LKVLNSKSETIIRRRDNARKAKKRDQKDKKILDSQFNRTHNRNNEVSTREGGGGISKEIFNDELILQGS